MNAIKGIMLAALLFPACATAATVPKPVQANGIGTPTLSCPSTAYVELDCIKKKLSDSAWKGYEDKIVGACEMADPKKAFVPPALPVAPVAR